MDSTTYQSLTIPPIVFLANCKCPPQPPLVIPSRLPLSLSHYLGQKLTSQRNLQLHCIPSKLRITPNQYLQGIIANDMGEGDLPAEDGNGDYG